MLYLSLVIGKADFANAVESELSDQLLGDKITWVLYSAEMGGQEAKPFYKLQWGFSISTNLVYS